MIAMTPTKFKNRKHFEEFIVDKVVIAGHSKETTCRIASSVGVQWFSWQYTFKKRELHLFLQHFFRRIEVI